jgi:predicted esterase
LKRPPAFAPVLAAVLASLAVLCATANARAESPRRGGAPAATTVLGEPSRLTVPGSADAFYYKPVGRGPKPVLMFLHGRNGNPAEDCRKWAKVGTQFGWVVCPQGPEDHGAGNRSWNNSVPAGKHITDGALAALEARFKGRVRKRNNILIGFSEGAYIAMQLGLHDPATWDRWLILAANDRYWYGDADTEALFGEARRKVKRVFLLTGESDGVAENTRRVARLVKDARIPVRVRITPGMGHEVPADRMVVNYRRPLLWLSAAK